MYIIYGLEDPRDHLYHYIGLTTDVYARFAQHLNGSFNNIEKSGWIWECRQANIMILMKELERRTSLEEAEEREAFWMSHYRQLGHPLSNKQHGRVGRRDRYIPAEGGERVLEMHRQGIGFKSIAASYKSIYWTEYRVRQYCNAHDGKRAQLID